MNGLDVMAIGAPLCAGSTLLARSVRRRVRPGAITRAKGRIADVHIRINAALVRAGLFRFPGVHLVDPQKGWIAGEAVFFCAASFLVTLSSTSSTTFLSIVLAFFAGCATVYVSLRDAARKQIDEIRRSLPTASFLLSLLLEAGMGSHAALQEAVGALSAGPLPRELEEIARGRTLGIPREEALEKSRCRVPLDDYRLFLNLIQQGERLGVGLSQGLRDLSSKMMETQEHRAEALAQTAAVKLLFPLVVFIFPAVFLIILSPVILSLIGTWGR